MGIIQRVLSNMLVADRVVYVVEDRASDAFHAIYVDGRLAVANPRRDVHAVLSALGIKPRVARVPRGFDGNFPDSLAKLRTE
jgi:hypothetical protein